MGTRKKLTVIFYVSLLILQMSASGCGDGRPYPSPSKDDTDGSFLLNEGTVNIGSSEYRADFGTMTVRENRNKPASRLIHLPFIRIHSSSKDPREPIFCLSGGPGASNLSWDWKLMGYLLDEHDIVAVGYRGADGSTILDCPEVAQAFRGSDVLGDGSMRTIGRAWTRSAQRLTAEGIDLEGYTIPEVIADNEAVRNALRYDRISLLSGSYGTRVAYLYGLMHPASIRRSAMVTVNPPGHFVWEPKMIDMQLKRYSTLWSRDPVMSLKSGDLYTTVQKVLKTMPRQWLFFPIDAGKVKVMTFILLFHRSTAAMVFDAYVAAERGDPSGLLLMSLAYDHFGPSMATWGDLASKAVSADFDSSRNYCLEMEPKTPALGSPLSKLYWGPLSYGRWPIGLLPEKFRTAADSDVETLLLSGSLDFSTPAEYATNEMLPHLKNGRQIILSEAGHFKDIMSLRPENTRRMLTGFYDTGVPDTSMNTYVPMDFSVTWKFPFIAKAGIGLLILVGIGLIAGTAWMVKKVW